ncbi:MAG: pyridoxamine 5'-phosphate oxidase family protein [Flavobacteriales bacterium]|nr:pyridoxamine 5'-phosphate oxidase family protein [Flavobacteriales bacterium]
MAKFMDRLDDRLMAFIAAQRMFFVGTAPNHGRVNLSPKGLNTFLVLSPQRAGYLDLTGSGNETAAHLRDNGRLTFMFCAFEGAPLILRLYGTGQVVRPADEGWLALRPSFGDTIPGERQIILLHIESVQTSCGFGVPLYTHEGERQQLIDWAVKKGEDGVRAYQADRNARSIDGLPA